MLKKRVQAMCLEMCLDARYHIYSVKSETSVPERYGDNSTVRYERTSRKAVYQGKVGCWRAL